MGDEEKELQPEKEKTAEAKPAAPSGEVMSDEEFAELLDEKFGKFKDLAKLLPSFKTVDGDLVRGVEWLDPKKGFQRKEFLTKEDFAKQRKLLSNRLRLWAESLSESDALDEIRKTINEKMTKLEANLEKNMKRVHRASRDIEETYRTVDKFFANAQQEPDEKVNAWFANVSPEELMDPDDKEKFEQLSKAVADLYREWSIKECFSLAVLPGWAGSVENIDTIARQMGKPNKLHVMTDLPNLEEFEEVMDMLEDPAYENITGIDDFKQYVSLFTNYIMARPGNQYEDEDMWVSPAAAVAGKIYQGDVSAGMQQPTAGFKYGKIADSKYIRFRANQVDASKISEKGVNTMVNFEGSVVAMGSSTLSNKETFNVYSIRRAYDYVYKTLRNYLNKQTFSVIDQKFIDALRRDISEFMEAISGEDSILEDYEIEIFADEEMRKKQEVDIKVALNPKYPARTFNIEFEAWNEDDRTNVKDK